MKTNIGSMLEHRAKLSPTLEAFVDSETDFRASFAETNLHANRSANVLISLGVKPGDRIALLMHNCFEFISLFYGAAKIGAVVVPLNTRLTASELSFILNDSGSKILISHSDFLPTIEQIKTSDESNFCVDKCLYVESVASSEESLNDLLSQADTKEPNVTLGDQDNLFIMYTSGTTGLPKGVVHSHESIMWAALCWVTTMDVRFEDRMLLPLPMFHVAALTGVIFSALRGICLVSMSNFEPSRAWKIIEKESVCIGAAVPAILNFMRQTPEFETLDAPEFRCFITGGAAMPASLTKLYNSKGMQVVQGYALTESGGGGTFLMNEYAITKVGSVGKPTLFTEVCVSSGENEKLQVGTGEVLMRGKHMMKEYWNRPEATKDAFDDGWFKTGDIAEIDEDGFIYIKDRIKDMVISGGENIYPAEIENVIQAHPKVNEIAVIGLPDEKWGEIVCAVVVSNSPELNKKDILDFCEQKLSRFKLPKKVVFVDSIPRNPSGKALKRILREQYS